MPAGVISLHVNWIFLKHLHIQTRCDLSPMSGSVVTRQTKPPIKPTLCILRNARTTEALNASSNLLLPGVFLCTPCQISFPRGAAVLLCTDVPSLTADFFPYIPSP